jgi:hypothetical protein
MAGVVQFNRAAPSVETEAQELTATPPASLSEAAFHGPAGRLVKKIEPETEADSFALLGSVLAAVGNLIGRNAYVMAGNSRHYPALFLVMVGETAKARKGTSWAAVRAVVNDLDLNWSQKCQCAGLSTGEGLIWAIHDPIEKQEPVKEKGRVTGYQTIVVESGIDDKRLMVVEGEFGQVLKVMTREGNTLSTVIRNGWDCPEMLELKSKGTPARASKPLISVIGHITHEELKSHLSHSDTFNGFANRFMWGYVRRSKLLPRGGRIDLIDFSPEVAELRSAIDSARKGGRREFDAAAQELWDSMYEKLSAGHPGVFGAVTSRSEAQVMRIALLYSLLDGADVIKEEHLRAALAFWKFAEDSARFLFGNSEARSDANRILAALHERGDAGMSKAEINIEVFSRNLDAARLKDALAMLKSAGVADARTETATGGRPREIWYPVAAAKE